jgi:RNA polymerase sigma factor (sigma-70 family)
MSEPPTDDRLLERAGHDDRSALNALIRRYANLVHGVALRQTGDPHLAADVSQGVFIVFVRRIRSIRHARVLPAWFLQTTRLAVKAAMRSAARRRHHERLACLPEQAMREPHLDDPDLLSELDEAVSSLPQGDRELVLMKYHMGWTMTAISSKLDINEEAARKRLSRAVERLREIFAKRRATMSTASVAALLIAAGAHSAPAAVVQASIAAATTSAATTSLGAAIASKLAGAMLLSKLKLAACVLVMTLGIVGTVAAVGVLQSRPAGPPQPPPAQASPLKSLEEHYALADGQVLRLIEPPFPAARSAFLAKEFPGVRAEVGSLGFLYAPGGLTWRHLSMSGLTLDRIATSMFELDWYTVMGLDLVPWDPIPADVVVREGASTRQKLDALAELIGQRTGQQVKFAQRKVPRPCLVLRGKTELGLKNKNGRHAVLLSQQPLDGPTRLMLTNEDRPRGFHVSSNMDGASERVAAPFFSEPTTGIERNVRFLVATDARLDPADPELVPKLKRIAENLRAQVGGEWNVEIRELDVWVMERMQL